MSSLSNVVKAVKARIRSLQDTVHVCLGPKHLQLHSGESD